MSKSIKVGFSIKGLYQYYHMIRPIIEANDRENIDFYIFHANKFYRYHTGNIEITDATLVNLVGTGIVVKKIKETNLDYMIIFNPGQIFDVFITAICKENNIKTIYYQHGLSLDFGSFGIKSIQQGKSVSDRILSLRRYLFFYRVMIYNIFLVKHKKRLLKLLTKRSKQVLFNFGNADYPKYGLKEFHCDIGLVFGQKDKKYLTTSNGFKEKDVVVGGYPLLKSSGQDNDLPAGYVLYLSSGLLTSKVIPITKVEEREFYVNLAKKVIDSDNNLVIKLHPTENFELFKDYIKDFDKAIVFKNYNLSDIVERANLVIGDYSTALFYPIKHLKPLLLLQSEFFEKYPFDYSDYGIGQKVNFNELDHSLANPPEVNEKNYSDFMLEFISNEQGIDSNEVLYNQIFSQKNEI
jgi:hypothetical protein